MIDRVVITPRWGASAGDDWYPWLAAELADVGAVVIAPLCPTPDMPRIADCLSALDEVGAADPARTMFVGHGVGCQALVRWMADRHVGRVGGLLCVAGWWTVDNPSPELQPWLDEPLHASAIRDAAPRMTVLLSDDDPCTADWTRTRRDWEKRLGARVTVLPGAGHFTAGREPAVLDAARALLAAQ